MISLTKTTHPTELARAVVMAKGIGAIRGHISEAAARGLELAYELPASFGQSAEWYLDNEASLSQGKAILYGDDGLEVQMIWAKFRLAATAAY